MANFISISFQILYAHAVCFKDPILYICGYIMLAVMTAKYSYTPNLCLFRCGLVQVYFTHVIKGHFTGTGAITWLSQCQRNNHENISKYITWMS